MLAKTLFLLFLLAAIIYGLYLLGLSIYNHFVDDRQQKLAELEEAQERLENTLRKARNNAI